MKEFQYKYVPRPAMCLQEYPTDENWLQIEKKQNELNDDMFYQRMERDDKNITSYKLGICGLKSKMRNWPEDELKKVLVFILIFLVSFKNFVNFRI